MRTSKPTLALLAALAAFGGLVNLTHAQSVTTTPVGAVNIDIPASSNGTAYNIAQIGAPLLKAPIVLGSGSSIVTPSGKLTGRIAAITATTVQVTDAGWTASQLAQTGFPIFFKITSGAGTGRYIYVTANTADTLTLAAPGLDLTTAGLVVGGNGDTFELFGGDTLLTLFGTTSDGVIGGTATQFSAGQVDRISFNNVTNNTTYSYYFNTDTQQWRRSGSGADQGNTVIAPYSGILYSRISTSPLSLTILGEVPRNDLKIAVPLLGVTAISNYFPTDTTLLALGLHNLSDWKKVGINGVTIATADKVSIKNGLTTYSYYYDGTLNYWRRSGSGANQNTTPVTTGSALRLERTGQNGAFETWNFASNYTL